MVPPIYDGAVICGERILRASGMSRSKAAAQVVDFAADPLMWLGADTLDCASYFLEARALNVHPALSTPPQLIRPAPCMLYIAVNQNACA